MWCLQQQYVFSSAGRMRHVLTKRCLSSIEAQSSITPSGSLISRQLPSKEEGAIFILYNNQKIMKVFLPQESIILPWIKRQFKPHITSLENWHLLEWHI